MRTAERKADLLMAPGPRGGCTIVIALQDARRDPEINLGSLGHSIAGIDISHRRRVNAPPWPVIVGIGPDTAGLRSLAPSFEHRCGGFVGEQPLGSPQSLEDVIAQGT